MRRIPLQPHSLRVFHVHVHHAHSLACPSSYGINLKPPALNNGGISMGLFPDAQIFMSYASISQGPKALNEKYYVRELRRVEQNPLKSR